jgi:hypothetical protein
MLANSPFLPSSTPSSTTTTTFSSSFSLSSSLSLSLPVLLLLQRECLPPSAHPPFGDTSRLRLVIRCHGPEQHVGDKGTAGRSIWATI